MRAVRWIIGLARQQLRDKSATPNRLGRGNDRQRRYGDLLLLFLANQKGDTATKREERRTRPNDSTMRPGRATLLLVGISVVVLSPRSKPTRKTSAIAFVQSNRERTCLAQKRIIPFFNPHPWKNHWWPLSFVRGQRRNGNLSTKQVHTRF